MVELVQVNFNSPNKIYCPGQKLRLEFVLRNTKKIKIKFLTVRFLGHAETKWSSGKYTKTGKEEYFRFYSELIAPGSGPKVEFQPGDHEMRTEFDLPSKLPATFDHTRGFISYEIRIEIEPKKAPKTTYREVFTVISPLDLNQFPKLQEPAKVEGITEVGYCCARSPIELVLSLPRTGFGFNEPVQFAVEFENRSNQDFSEIYIVLTQKITFFADKSKDTRKERFIVATVAFPGAQKHQKKVYNGEILIPNENILTDISACRFIQNEYILTATIPSTDLKVKQVIVLGSIPYHVNREEPVVEQPMPKYGMIEPPVTQAAPTAPPNDRDDGLYPPIRQFEDIQKVPLEHDPAPSAPEDYSKPEKE